MSSLVDPSDHTYDLLVEYYKILIINFPYICSYLQILLVEPAL